MTLHALRCAASLLVVLAPTAFAQNAAAPKADDVFKPWRLQNAAEWPEWLKVSGSQRTRFENLSGQFRAATNLDESDHLWALRTGLRADATFDHFVATAELMDSRQIDADRGSALDTTTVNAGELLQLFGGYTDTGVFEAEDKASLLVGRQTLDVGSHRLVARNDYRNTINTFTGVNATWEAKDKTAVQAFYVLPVRRIPADLDSLLDNDVEFDEDHPHAKFWGVHTKLQHLFESLTTELYYFGLDEDDAPGRTSANRRLSTVGARARRPAAKSEWDYEVEAAYQFGDSRSSTASSNTTDLDHKAEFVHFDFGYSFASEGKQHLSFLFDYASGDDSPNDGENNRFDTLYGARRWEFGPTGIFGALARSNLVSPGLRFNCTPREDVEVMVADRLAYLASDSDAFTTAGVRDSTGGSGDYVGNMAEVRVRWHVVPKSVSFEIGAAYLAAGGFLDDAPNASGNGDTTYAYVQSTLSF